MPIYFGSSDFCTYQDLIRRQSVHDGIFISFDLAEWLTYWGTYHRDDMGECYATLDAIQEAADDVCLDLDIINY